MLVGLAVGGAGFRRLDVEGWSRAIYGTVFLGMLVSSVAVPALFTSGSLGPDLRADGVLSAFLGS